MSGEIDLSETRVRRRLKRGETFTVSLRGGQKLIFRDTDFRFRTARDRLISGGSVEALVARGRGGNPRPSQVWQLRHNGDTIYSFEEAVAYHNWAGKLEGLLIVTGSFLMVGLVLINPSWRERHQNWFVFSVLALFTIGSAFFAYKGNTVSLVLTVLFTSVSVCVAIQAIRRARTEAPRLSKA